MSTVIRFLQSQCSQEDWLHIATCCKVGPQTEKKKPVLRIIWHTIVLVSPPPSLPLTSPPPSLPLTSLPPLLQLTPLIYQELTTYRPPDNIATTHWSPSVTIEGPSFCISVMLCVSTCPSLTALNRPNKTWQHSENQLSTTAHTWHLPFNKRVQLLELIGQGYQDIQCANLQPQGKAATIHFKSYCSCYCFHCYSQYFYLLLLLLTLQVTKTLQVTLHSFSEFEKNSGSAVACSILKQK